jgi:FkbM family methyltransferase
MGNLAESASPFQDILDVWATKLNRFKSIFEPKSDCLVVEAPPAPPRLIFGRSLERLVRNSAMLPYSLLGAAYSPIVFRRPLRVLQHYITRTFPSDRMIETRRGLRIHLSGDEDDVVTVFLNFVRRDYGSIPPGSVVVDVGAHLGAFSLFAISQGASRVYSFEPDPELFRVLVSNVEENHLGGRISPFGLAVGERNGEEIFFRRAGNASGHVVQNAMDSDIPVQSVTLAGLMAANKIERINLLKLDCEGSEYGIIQSTPADTWRRIDRIRLEFHNGNTDEIKSRLRANGFRATRERHHGNGEVGLLWFDRE